MVPLLGGYPEDDTPPALGAVLVEGRGSLPFALLHGESLVACAAWAMGAAGIDLLDLTTDWAAVRDAGRPLVLHDSLCPATPPGFLADAVALARQAGRPVAGYRPVTDTMKSLREGRVTSGAAREDLVQLASPLVLPVEVVARLGSGPGIQDLEALWDMLTTGPGSEDPGGIEWLEAPASGRRVLDEDDLRVLEAAGTPR